MSKLEFKFDANLDYQRHAIDSVVNLFEGYEQLDDGFAFGQDIIANMDEFDQFDFLWLGDNLRNVQETNNARDEHGSPLEVLLDSEPERDSGIMLEGVSNDSHEAPHFTIEMETGTGKTYVYLRTIRELYKKYGWRKFIIVVPSVAIFEGVKKSFNITKGHLAGIYGNAPINLIEYDGSQPGRLRDFAKSHFLSIMLITIQAFNTKKSRNFYKETDKLMGERLPYQFIQETRPVVILDEPQNMESERAQSAIRTLAPLFVLRYSATHKSNPNRVYRLTPIDAFRQNLVKQIQVIGISDLNLNTAHVLRLEEVNRIKGQKPTATVRAVSFVKGKTQEVTLTLKGGDDLFGKTNNPDHRGVTVENIVYGKRRDPSKVIFSDGSELTDHDALGNREAVFRAQIEKTIEQHIAHQKRLKHFGVKVLSLFFIDRVANYTNDDGIIKRLFDESFERLKQDHPDFDRFEASEVRDGYFSKMVNSKTGEATYLDTMTETSNAAKETFELIMRDKERLLSFDEPVSFIFAHSALKEGWDNPNVFQICTLNNTSSTIKKRQEIGRGLRLCVDGEGKRPDNPNINILTVIANESYEHYVNALQEEYIEDGEHDSAPPQPSKSKDSEVTRRDKHYHSEAFKQFWQHLCQKLEYRIKLDSEELIDTCIEKLNEAQFPEPSLTIKKGYFRLVEYSIALVDKPLKDGKVEVNVSQKQSSGQEYIAPTWRNVFTEATVGTDLGKELGFKGLRGFKVAEVGESGGQPTMLLETLDGSVAFSVGYQHHVVAKQATAAQSVEWQVETQHYPIDDFISRAAEATRLTRRSILEIFKGVAQNKRELLFTNPRGWANVFSNVIERTVKDFIAKNLCFERLSHADFDLEELFPEIVIQPQKELIEGNEKALYDKVQVDSEVERAFIKNVLGEDIDNIVFFFKFPPKFKIGLPTALGNYNPDWGIVREYRNGEVKRLELVRETKGSEDEATLRFDHERRKIWAARRYFKALQDNNITIDYRVVTSNSQDYWRSKDDIASGKTGDDQPTLNLD